MSCSNCKFKCADRYVKGSGSTDPEFVLLTDYPDNTALYEGELLRGDSGGLVNWAMRETGIIKNSKERDEKVWVDSALKCYPTTRGASTAFNVLKPMDIKKFDLMNCRNRMAKNIAELDPKFVVTLGGPAFQAAMDDYSLNVTEHHSHWHYSESLEKWIMPIISPAAALTTWEHTSAIVKAFRHVKKAIDNGVPKYKLPKYYTPKDFKEAMKMLKYLSRKKKLAWDTETTSLEFWNPEEELIGFSFSSKAKQGLWFPLLLQTQDDGTRVRRWSPTEERKIVQFIKRILENKKIKKIGQNTKFDINFVREVLGIEVKGTHWDTMQFHHLVDENTQSNLTYLTSYYDVEMPPYEFDMEKVKVNNYLRYEYIDAQKLGRYACADTDAVFRVYDKQQEIATKRQLRLYNKFSHPLSKVLAVMERRGALLDIPRIGELEKEYQAQIDSKNIKLARMVKLETVNVASPKQMQALLYTQLKLQCPFKTKTGAPSTGKDAFEHFRRKYKDQKKVMKILDMITTIRGMRKMKSTYLTGFKDLVDLNNRVHTSYMSIGTVTGRVASRSPNLQNIPRDVVFRKLFIAGPGRKIIIADYAQVEARLIAYLANDKVLINKFYEEGFDIHTYNTAQALRRAVEDVTGEERSKGKAVTFGMNYGRSAGSIAYEYDIPLEEVEEFIEGYFNAYPKIAEFREKCKQVAEEQLYLETNTGRRRHFVGMGWVNSPEMAEAAETRRYHGLSYNLTQRIKAGMLRQAMNFPIQSFAHDCLILAEEKIQERFEREGLDATLMMTVHDEILIDCEESIAEYCKQIVNDEMTFKLGTMEFPTDAKISDYWDH